MEQSNVLLLEGIQVGHLLNCNLIQTAMKKRHRSSALQPIQLIDFISAQSALEKDSVDREF